MNLNDYETNQLAELRGQLRMNIARLEKKGAMRTIQDNDDLRAQRALMRRVTIEIKGRVVQLPLL